MPERKLPLCRWKTHTQRATHVVAIEGPAGRSAKVVCEECAAQLVVGQALANSRRIFAINPAS